MVLEFVSVSVSSSICLVSLYDQSLYTITRVVLVQPVTISVALDCVTWGEIVVHPYDSSLLGRLELTVAMGQSRVRRWF